jgi:hypothetical protein
MLPLLAASFSFLIADLGFGTDIASGRLYDVP